MQRKDHSRFLGITTNPSAVCGSRHPAWLGRIRKAGSTIVALAVALAVAVPAAHAAPPPPNAAAAIVPAKRTNAVVPAKRTNAVVPAKRTNAVEPAKRTNAVEPLAPAGAGNSPAGPQTLADRELTVPEIARSQAVAKQLKGHRHGRACAPKAGRAACTALVDLNVDGPLASANAIPDGYAPADLQAAYRLPSRSGGAGHTVAVVDAYDAPTAAADLAVYRAKYGLPACKSGCFSKVNQKGTTSPLPRPDSGWAQEVALDLAMVSAACPNCKVLLVEADSDGLGDLAEAVATAVRLGADAVSNSYGAGEFPNETTLDEFYRHPGVTITASTGDLGYGVQYPAASPYVTAVGGTSLMRTSTGWAETAWGGAGSGCSAYEAKPAWQHDAGCSRRTVADISAVADPATGVAVYDSYTHQGASGWLVFGGTSAAAPLVAGASLLGPDQPATKYPVEFAYQKPGGLNDVVSGSNGSCIVRYFCTSVACYDGPTGLGSPMGVSSLTSLPAPAVQPQPFGCAPLNDLSADLASDVVARDSTGVLWLYPGDGSGKFATRTRIGAGWNVMTAIVGPGDFTGDGHSDLLARDSGGVLWLYPGNGRGGLGTRIRIGAGWNVMTSIAGPGDFSGDSRPDVIARDSGGTLWLYLGNGSGGFTNRLRLGAGWNVMTAVTGTGDFNGDRRSDLLARDTGGTLWLYPGNGRGGFVPRVRLGAGWNIMTAIAGTGDFNGDGWADLLARDGGGVLWLYPGNGYGGFAPRALLGAGWNVMTAIL